MTILSTAIAQAQRNHLVNTIILILSIAVIPLILRLKFTVRAKPARRPTPRNKNGYSIPVEIYLHILSLLDTPELISMLRVSRYFHYITAPIIFRIIYASVNITIPYTALPLSVKGIPIPEPKPPARETHLVLKSSVDTSGIQTDIRQIIFKLPLPNLCEFVTHLIIPQHPRWICATMVPIAMPLVQSLRIRPSGTNDGIALCGTASDIGCCPLIANLRPRQLIIGDSTTGYTGSFNGIWSTSPPSFPPPFVKHLVVLLGFFVSNEPDQSLLQQISKTVERVSFVLSSGQRDWRYLEVLGGNKIEEGLEQLGEYDPVEMAVARAAVGGAKSVEIVGVEMIQKAMDDGDVHGDRPWDLKADVLAEFERLSSARGCSGDEAKRRGSAIRFTDEATFEKQEGWYTGQKAESKEALVAKVLEVARARKAAALIQARLEQARLEQARQTDDEDCAFYRQYSMCSVPNHYHQNYQNYDDDD